MDKFKRTFNCFSSCSSSSPTNRRRQLDSPTLSSDEYSCPGMASTMWIRARDHDFPEIRDKCCNVFSRICNHHRRRQSSADFRYDPLSYALNFQNRSYGDDESLTNRNFSSRLPASPAINPVVVSREINAFN